jgi:hypothetical protein
MLRDSLTQKCVQKILVTDFGYPRACRFRRHQKKNRLFSRFLSRALGYPKSVTKKFCTHFWVNKSLSMMWIGFWFNPNLMNQKMVTDFGYSRACRFIKMLNKNRLWLLPLPTFFKTWFKFIKYSQNWPKLTNFQTSLCYFHVYLVVEHILTTNTVKNSW